MFIGASFAALLALGALASREARAPGPLAKPHADAHLPCASCHAQGNAPSSCITCHSADSHASARPAHRALASAELRCITCHPAHGDAQGVTFFRDGRFTRWSGESGAGPSIAASVPFVSAAACARCHDAANVRDPAARCITKSGLVTCFDEHRRDRPSRFVAWDAARSLAESAAPPAPRGHAPWLWIAFALVPCVALFAFSRRRPSHAPPALPAPPARARLPIIDESTCLGCYACVDACPFDVLAIERYVAVVARPKDCCGVILCAQACPNGSLRIEEGEATPERPRLDEHLESVDAPGVFLAGDLTGLPLIKNAIQQGTRVIDRIASQRPRLRGADADVVVVGTGPAGLAAMLRAKERGLRAIALEQGALASSIRNFPRNKIVYDPPLDLPVEGSMWLRQATKEELVAQWSRIARTHALDVREGHRVTAVRREDDALIVEANHHDATYAFRAARLVLAIGKRGTPRRLDVPVAAEVESKVSYALADARSFAGAHVLVVGLGDSAMEAAIALAKQPDATVTVSYRGADFSRGKARNITELRALAARGKVHILFGSEVASIETKTATLRVGEAVGGENLAKIERIPNDAVLVLIGGAPSWDLVRAAGVRFEAPSLLPPENLLRPRP